MRNSTVHPLRAIACMNTFTFGGAQAMMIALYPALAWALHLDIATIIASFSVGSFLFLIGSPYWSNTSDFLGRHTVLTIGNAALLISFALIVFLVNYPLASVTLTVTILLMSQILYGLVASATVPAAQALHVDLAPKSSSVRTILIHSMSLSLGRVVGYALIVLFHEQFKIELLVYLFFIITVFLIIISYRGEIPLRPKHRLPPSSWKLEIFKMRWIIVIAFLFACFLETLLFSLAGTIKNQFQFDSLSSSGISANILLVMSIGIFVIEWSGNTLLKESWRTGLFVGVIALLIGSLVLATADSLFDLWIAMTFCVIGIGLMPSCYLSLLRKEGAANSYGKRAGIIAASHTFGYTAGGIVAAVVFKMGNIQIGFVLAFIALILGFICLKQSELMSYSPISEAL